MLTRGPVGQTQCEPPNDDGPKEKRDERSEGHEDRTTHNVDDVVYASIHPGPIDDDCKQREGQSPRNTDKSHQRDERRSHEGVIRGEPVVSNVRNERLEVLDRKRARIVVEEAPDLSKVIAEYQEYSGRNSPPKCYESWPTI